MSEQNQNRNNRSSNNNGRNRNGGGGNSRNRNSGGGGGGGGNRRGGGQNRGGSEASQKRNELQPSHSRRSQKPEPLTFWQKVKKAIGLYKEPEAKQAPKPSKKAPAKKSGRVAGGGRVENKGGGDTKAKGNQRNRTAGTKREGGSTPPPTEVKTPRLYVGNLSYDATEYDLEELFKGIGSIRNVELVYNRHTHKSKGYGFITMANVEEGERAVEVLHDQPFMGRKMIVNGARSTGANESSDSGGERPRRASKKSAPRRTSSDDIPADEEVHSLAPKED